MKYHLVIIFSIVLLSFQNSYSHKQHVHQYIIREAYSLLKNQIGDIPIMANHISTSEGGGGGTWLSGLITAAAWNEDEQDVVYHLSNANPPDVTGPSDEIIKGADIVWPFGPVRDAYVSSTHFWKADNGNVVKTDLEGNADITIPALNLDLGTVHFKFTIPNAYQKILNYAYGGWLVCIGFGDGPDDRGYYVEVTKPDGDILRLYPGTMYDVCLTYGSLADLYKTKIMSTDNIMYTGYTMYNVSKGRPEWWKGNVILSDKWRDRLVWEILGRMCHLLGDMSVPAHAHDDEHGTSPDSYEDWIGGDRSPYQYWNASNVQSTYGGFIDPYISSNPLHYLMYTMSEISDHFGSNGPYNGDGNDVVGGNPLPEETSYFTSHPLSSLGGPTTQSGPFDPATTLPVIRDATLPYVIRATAGLLYWFGKETNLIPIRVPQDYSTLQQALASTIDNVHIIV